MGKLSRPRAKKGAHYSAPVRVSTRPGLRWLAGALCCALSGMAAPAGAPASPQADARKTEEQLQAVKSEIERVTREVSAEQVERDRLTRELKGAELSLGNARERLLEVRRHAVPHSPPRSARARSSWCRPAPRLPGRCAPPT